MWKRLGNFIAGASTIWSLVLWVQSSFVGSTTVIGNVEIHPPAYLLLWMLGSAILIGLNYELFHPWVSDKFKSQASRFCELSEQIDEFIPPLVEAVRIDQFKDAGGTSYQLNVANRPLAIELTTRLEPLGITMPRSNDSTKVWLEHMSRLAPLARTRNIRAARTLKPPSMVAPSR